MKNMILTIAMMMLGSSLAFAGSLKADDFNEMIQQSQQSEAELRQNLQKEAGIQLNQDKPGTISKEDLEIPQETEQIAVSTSDSFWRERNDHSGKQLEKATMKRLSQELNESAR